MANAEHTKNCGLLVLMVIKGSLAPWLPREDVQSIEDVTTQHVIEPRAITARVFRNDNLGPQTCWGLDAQALKFTE